MAQHIKPFARLYLQRLRHLLDTIDVNQLQQATQLLAQAYKTGKTVFLIGNGGSASTANHMACDLSKGVRGHTGKNIKRGFRAISLADNPATITAWANDTQYEHVYAEQVRTLGKKNDLLIAISASGNSPNILTCVALCKKMNMKVITLTGFDGGKLARRGDVNIIIPCHAYGPVEDIHLILNHIVTAYFFEKFKG